MNGLMAEAAAAGRCTDKVTPLYYLITTRLTHSFSLVLKARAAVGDANFKRHQPPEGRSVFRRVDSRGP